MKLGGIMKYLEIKNSIKKFKTGKTMPVLCEVINANNQLISIEREMYEAKLDDILPLYIQLIIQKEKTKSKLYKIFNWSWSLEEMYIDDILGTINNGLKNVQVIFYKD